MKWILASERMPGKSGRYIVKRLGEPLIADAILRNGDVMVFAIPNGMTWKGYKDFEWLDESVDETNGWVSVKDNLPNPKQKCLVTTKDSITVHVGVYIHDLKQWAIERETISRSFFYFVTHWMPLPNPPQQ